MNRRDLLRLALSAGAGVAVGSGNVARLARAQLPPNDRRVLLSMTLRGGPDFRHLIVPAFDPNPGTYGYTYWANRFRAHGIGQSPAEWENRWQQEYLHLDVNGAPFGILRRAEWLKNQFDAGNVAIVNNVLAAESRDHHHGVIVYETGDRSATPNDLSRDGWGGRLAKAVGGNVVSMTRQVRLFCNGPHPSDPSRHDNGHVITARDTRNMAFHYPSQLVDDPTSNWTAPVLTRALQSYYAAKGATIPAESPYHRFVQHERSIRDLGDLVTARLSQVQIPPAILPLYGDESTLDAASFGEQIRDVFDSFACSDLLNLRVGSLMYDGWDTHKDQANTIEPKFADIFGLGGGLDALFSSLWATMPSAAANTVLVLGGDFGRQLRDNGDNGTDHGRGGTVLLIGEGVAGGVYGDLFPEAEIPLYSEASKDTLGLTAIEQVFAAVCNWIEPGVGTSIFPGLAEAPVEDGVVLENLFTA